MLICLLKQSPTTASDFLACMAMAFQLYIPNEFDKQMEYLELILEKSSGAALDCSTTSRLGIQPKLFFYSRQWTFHAKLLQQVRSILIAIAQYLRELSNRLSLYMLAAELEYRMARVLQSECRWQQARPYSQQFRALMKSLFLKYSLPIDLIQLTSPRYLLILLISAFSIATRIICRSSQLQVYKQGYLMNRVVIGPSPFFQLQKQGA